MQYKIIFEKWYPPFAEETIDDEFLPMDEEELKELEEQGVNIHQVIENSKQYVPAVHTQFGTQPINQNYDPFDFWTVHTNFYITNQVYKILLKCEGIEYLEPLTPYRFKIAIGRAFDRKKTLLIIKRKLEKHNAFGVL